MKVRNGYYLLAGVLAVLFAVTHAWNGHSAVLPALDSRGISLETRTVFTYVWHIVTAENLVFGIAFLLLSFQQDRTKSRYAAWTIAALLLVRLAVIVGVTAWFDRSALTDTMVDSLAIVLYVVLILLGTGQRRKRSGVQTLP
ncbi:hypothetical protein J31TS4_14620 [Paenibacillus sp. J31TS4]|uniref:hypothetical protein n=1 Tax=Paenibacillus sp. J31TS4 TaxID=2807195 RepID=UPI001B2CDDDE|nr:hypothetical protein [Paenibacillus sp. J31TS4]GIP38182.1 hypothetical protein J31TS4_14620 [Paenibacillus sp. J31TS4]